MEYVLSLCKTMTSPTVVQSALYTLAMAAEGNGESIIKYKILKNDMY